MAEKQLFRTDAYYIVVTNIYNIFGKKTWNAAIISEFINKYL